MDKDPANRPTYCLNLCDTPWPLPSDAFAEVLGIHVLEHLSQKSLDPALREIHRILKPGGVIRMHVPNGPFLAKLYVERPELRITLQGPIFGAEAETDPAFAHKVLYDFPMIAAVFLRNGFVNVLDVTNQYSDHFDDEWSWSGGRVGLKAIGVKSSPVA